MGCVTVAPMNLPSVLISLSMQHGLYTSVLEQRHCSRVLVVLAPVFASSLCVPSESGPSNHNHKQLHPMCARLHQYPLGPNALSHIVLRTARASSNKLAQAHPPGVSMPWLTRAGCKDGPPFEAHSHLLCIAFASMRHPPVRGQGGYRWGARRAHARGGGGGAGGGE